MCKGTLRIKTSKQQRYRVSWEKYQGKVWKDRQPAKQKGFQAVRIYPLEDKMLMKKFNQGNSMVEIPLKQKIPQWP